MIVIDLSKRLPPRYVAGPRVQIRAFEVDVGASDRDDADGRPFTSETNGNGGGVAAAVYAPPRPTLAVATDVPAQDPYEVQVFDAERGLRLVAAVEIVSPSNKDRPETRRPFVAKCAALLQQNVSVTIVDLVTVRDANLYGELLDLIGHADPALSPGPLVSTQVIPLAGGEGFRSDV